MAAIVWILIGGFIIFVLLLLARDEYYDKREKKRRMELRAAIEWPVLILKDDEPLEGKTVNISAGGALLCCPEQFCLNQVIRLIIRPPMGAPFEITAEVVRVNIQCADGDSSPQGTAVRFIIICEKDRQFLSFSVFDHLRQENLFSQPEERLGQM
jgi:c-di-GMP-binding flagellar brake protein YcgR